MKLRTLAALALAVSTLGVAGPAAAADKMMGLRFETAFVKDFNIASFGSGANARTDGAPVRNVVGTSPNGDIKVGYDLPGGLTPLIALGLRSESLKSFNTDDKQVSKVSATSIILDAELRYYFKPHKKGLQPYVWGEFNTTVVTIGSEADKAPTGPAKELNDATNSATADTLDVTEINAGLGMEYLFSKSFGIGGKWGLGVAFQGTGEHKGGGSTFGSKTSNTTFGTSTALYAAFRL